MPRPQIIAACIAFVLLLSGVYFIQNYNTILPPPGMRTEKDFTNVLQKSHSELFTKNNLPVFRITKIDHVQPRWYILSLQSKQQKSITTRIVIYDQHFKSSDMLAITNPQTSFSKAELAEYNLPPHVTERLER